LVFVRIAFSTMSNSQLDKAMLISFSEVNRIFNKSINESIVKEINDSKYAINAINTALYNINLGLYDTAEEQINITKKWQSRKLKVAEEEFTYAIEKYKIATEEIKNLYDTAKKQINITTDKCPDKKLEFASVIETYRVTIEELQSAVSKRITTPVYSEYEVQEPATTVEKLPILKHESRATSSNSYVP
jgi:hypothetical protein